MAFATNARVRITSENSAYRGKLGTVITAAANSPDGFVKVHIDGHPATQTINCSDAELGSTNFADPYAA